MTFSDGFPQLDGMALSPLEYELLLRSAERRSMMTIENELYELFGSSYEDQSEFHAMVRGMLCKFNAKYWLTHFVV